MLLIINEKNFTPSTLGFTTSKDGLYAFYRDHPEFENLLTTLLRTYEGIFDFSVFISELLIAKILRLDEKEIKTMLQKITTYGVVRYTPQNDAPQIVLRKNRVAAEDFQINLVTYNKRKEIFIQRVKTMINYLQQTACKSRFISQYFGDETASNCGICDTCLSRKRIDLSSEEFLQIANAIKAQLALKQVTADELLVTLPAIKKENAWKVLHFLQAEKKIAISASGLLHNA